MKVGDIRDYYVGDDGLYDEFMAAINSDSESSLRSLIHTYISIHERYSLELRFDLFRYEHKPNRIGVDFYLIRHDNKHLVYSTDPRRFCKGHGIHSCLSECERVCREEYGEYIKALIEDQQADWIER